MLPLTPLVGSVTILCMDDSRIHRGLARLYPLLSAEEKDDLLQALITASLRDPQSVSGIVRSYFFAKESEALIESVDIGKEKQ